MKNNTILLKNPKGEKTLNSMRIEFDAKSANESFARTVVASFASQLNPTIDEINDLKTAVSEAVTNSVVHSETKTIVIESKIWQRIGNKQGITVSVVDFGIGISDITKALEPFWTTKPEQERSGMGFTVMQSFMDDVIVRNNKGGGASVIMKKLFGQSGTENLRKVQ